MVSIEDGDVLARLLVGFSYRASRRCPPGQSHESYTRPRSSARKASEEAAISRWTLKPPFRHTNRRERYSISPTMVTSMPKAGNVAGFLLFIPQSFPKTQKAKSPTSWVGPSAWFSGAAGRNRTVDLRITNAWFLAYLRINRP